MHNTISVYATSFINRKTRTVMCAGDDVAGGGIDAGPVLCPYVDNHGRQGCTAWLGEQECMCRVSSLESKASSLWNLSLNLAKHFFSCCGLGCTPCWLLYSSTSYTPHHFLAVGRLAVIFLFPSMLRYFLARSINRLHSLAEKLVFLHFISNSNAVTTSWRFPSSIATVAQCSGDEAKKGPGSPCPCLMIPKSRA